MGMPMYDGITIDVDFMDDEVAIIRQLVSDAELTEKDAIFSPSGTYIIQIPDVSHYRIREGTLFISPHAAKHCKRLRYLDIPVEFVVNHDLRSDFPFPLQIKVWDTHYDGTPAEDVEKEYELAILDKIIDDHNVGYSKDNKILKYCCFTFNETHYEVPDGVEVIENPPCAHFLGSVSELLDKLSHLSI